MMLNIWYSFYDCITQNLRKTEHPALMPTVTRACARWNLVDMLWRMEEATPPRELGKGTFGQVQCRRASFLHNDGMDVAVKEYGLSDSDGVVYDMVREFVILQHLGREAVEHNIVQALGVSVRRCDQLPRLVMTLAHRSLCDYITTTQSCEVYQEWMEQLMCAVRYLHSMGVLHRDIKPGNILVHRDTESTRRLALADFGSSVILYREDQTLEPDVCTFPYASPEMLRGDKYGAPADVWSVGVTMADIFLRRRHFHGETPEEVLKSVLRGHDAMVHKMPKEWRELVDIDASKRLSTGFRVAQCRVIRRKLSRRHVEALDMLESIGTLFKCHIDPEVWKCVEHLFISDAHLCAASACAAISLAMKAQYHELADMNSLLLTSKVLLRDVVEAETRMLLNVDIACRLEWEDWSAKKRSLRSEKE